MSDAITEYLERTGFEAFAPKAVLFDMDGVLFNSMPNHAYAWRHAMAHFGIEMQEADAYKYEGMRGVETIKKLCKEQWGRDISDEESEEMYALKSELYASCPKAEKIEGVERLMRRIKECGMKICVVTGSGQRSLLDKLEHEFSGLVTKELMVTSFDVKRGKPEPDPYLMGLKKCGAEPYEAIVVENAPLGVRAGVAARILTVAVNTGPLPDTTLNDEGASIVLKSMGDLYDQWDCLIGIK